LANDIAVHDPAGKTRVIDGHEQKNLAVALDHKEDRLFHRMDGIGINAVLLGVVHMQGDGVGPHIDLRAQKLDQFGIMFHLRRLLCENFYIYHTTFYRA
jgi:hypothetical protein